MISSTKSVITKFADRVSKAYVLRNGKIAFRFTGREKDSLYLECNNRAVQIIEGLADSSPNE
jgi:hypothetical protein